MTDHTSTNTPGLSLPPVDPTGGQASQTVPAQQQPTAPVTDQAATPATQAAQPAAAGVPVDDAATPLIADDADLIEKAWVEKAKQLVEQTKNDPYVQNKEINKFKADYIKKRYQKDIKLTEE